MDGRTDEQADGTVSHLTDELIATLSNDQRRELIRRLRPSLDGVIPRPSVVRLQRRIRLALMVGGAIAMIPWIVYLAVSLPAEYHARNWAATWVGYDILMVTMMATTAYLGWRRRQLLMLSGFATGLLLLVDAWFDIMTADSRDVWVSVGTALLGEVPLAVLMMSGAIMLFRFIIAAHPLGDPADGWWRAKLPF